MSRAPKAFTCSGGRSEIDVITLEAVRAMTWKGRSEVLVLKFETWST